MKAKILIAIPAVLLSFSTVSVSTHASEPVQLEWRGIIPPPIAHTKIDTRTLEINANEQPIVESQFVVKAIHVENRKEAITVIQPFI